MEKAIYAIIVSALGGQWLDYNPIESGLTALLILGGIWVCERLIERLVAKL